MNKIEEKKLLFSPLDIAQMGMMVAIIEVSKFALAPFPNIELTSFWLIMFTLFMGRRIIAVVPAFILIEGAVYGVSIWWAMYLYIWPALVIVTWLFRKNTKPVFWAFVSGIFGLCYGLFCTIPYFILGFSTGGLTGGFNTAISWWLSGLPWDFAHCAGNFIIMLVLYRPVKSVIGVLNKH